MLYELVQTVTKGGSKHCILDRKTGDDSITCESLIITIIKYGDTPSPPCRRDHWRIILFLFSISF